MAQKTSEVRSKDLRQNKFVAFCVCLGILGLVAVSLHVSAPTTPKGELWRSKAYVEGSPHLDEAGLTALLGQVRDPEVDLTVPELGLVYASEIRGNRVYLLMTLTSPTCPWSQQLLTDIRHAVFSHPGVYELEVAVTFDPPWSLDRIDKAALARLETGLAEGAAPHIHTEGGPAE